MHKHHGRARAGFRIRHLLQILLTLESMLGGLLRLFTAKLVAVLAEVATTMHAVDDVRLP